MPEQLHAQDYLDDEFRASRRLYGVWQLEGAMISDGTTPGGRRYRCSEIGSYASAQELLRQGHTYLDGNSDGEACESRC